jgi:hypothetical protein
MKSYQSLTTRLQNETLIAQSLVNTPLFSELYVLQFRFLGDSFRHLVTRLTALTNDEFKQTINIKVIAFVVFVIAICIAYLTLWIPFVGKMTKDVR